MWGPMSALQKAIRRGQLENALYWASELSLGGFDHVLWSRLRVMCSEDIGVADNSIAPLVTDMELKAQRHAKEKNLYITHAVTAMVMARKSRLVVSATNAFFNFHHLWAREVPDEAYCRHTARGKKLGRGWDHFFEDAATLVNEATEILDPYRDFIWKHLKENTIQALDYFKQKRDERAKAKQAESGFDLFDQRGYEEE